MYNLDYLHRKINAKARIFDNVDFIWYTHEPCSINLVILLSNVACLIEY